MQRHRSLQLYDPLPAFQLADPKGQWVDIEDYRGLPGLLIAFVDCSSPSSRRLHAAIGELAWEYGRQGVGILLVNPTVASGADEESPSAMLAVAKEAGIMVPFLIDERQEVAKAFGVRRVPDFFLFNRDPRLAYHGRFDATDRRPGLAPDGAEMRRALDAMLAGEGVPVGLPSMGEPVEWQSSVGRGSASRAVAPSDGI